MKSRNELEPQHSHLQYRVILTRLGADFVVRIPELGLIAKDPDMHQAYLRLESMRMDYLKKMIECGYEDEIILPRQHKKKASRFFWRQLPALFFLSLVIFIGSMCFYLAQQKLTAVKNEVRAKVLRLPSRLCSNLDSLQPEQIDKYGKTLLNFLDRARPTTRKLCAYFSAVNAEAAKGSGGK